MMKRLRLIVLQSCRNSTDALSFGFRIVAGMELGLKEKWKMILSICTHKLVVRSLKQR
jgi:hypothetical protein